MSASEFEMRCSFCGRLHTEVAKLIAGPGIYMCDACVDKCVAILSEGAAAEPASLPEWASMSDEELLQRLPFIAASAANIEAGLRDRAIAYARDADGVAVKIPDFLRILWA